MKIPKKRTDSEVYRLGTDALINNFGTTGTSRFLNQIEPRTGNYTLERHEWLDKIDRKTGLELIRDIREVNIEVEIENKRIAKLKTDICGNGKPQIKRLREISDADLYRIGLHLLIDTLGPGGMSHFLRVCEPGTGVYAVDRYENPKLIEQTDEAEQKRAS